MATSLTVDISWPQLEPSQMAKTIRGALKVFDTYYRRRVQQRFAAQGPGWPPKKEKDADQSARAVAKLADHKIRRKLVKQLKGAQKRVLTGKTSTGQLVKKMRMLEEFKKQTGAAHSPFLVSDKRSSKSIAKMREKAHAAARSGSSPTLGRMANAMKSQIRGMVLEVRNTLPFSEVQNSGGVVGHGARLPPRPFNYVDQGDADVFAEIVTNLILAALA